MRNLASSLRLPGETATPWPDIILAKHFFTRVQLPENRTPSEAVKDAVRFFWHCLEPGGLFLLADAGANAEALQGARQDLASCAGSNKISTSLAAYWEEGLTAAQERKLDEAIKCLFGVAQFTPFNHNFVFVQEKPHSIYADRKVEVAPRSCVIPKDLATEAVLKVLDRLCLRTRASLLDVGTECGFYSRCLYREAKRSGWNYEGIELRSKEVVCRNDSDDFCDHIKFGTNFFGVSDAQCYDAVFLIHTLHQWKHWQALLVKASSLVRPGGSLVLGFRHDNFAFWREGIFLDDLIESRIRAVLQDYWKVRNELGLRHFDQLSHILPSPQALSFCQSLGMELIDLIQVQLPHEYELQEQDLLPDGEARWNVTHLGLLPSDLRALADKCKALPSWRLPLKEPLYQGVAMYVLRKPE